MSDWTERKRRFYRDIVVHGITRPEELTRIYPLGWNLEDTQLQKWFGNFFKTPKKLPYTGVPRLLNHFKQGADPEFILVHPETGDRVNAGNLSMRTGRAFGADNNGRLVEIRPWADKSQLKVTASILSTMRWMAIYHKETRSLEWLSGAFLLGDGLGGHVHIGRRRPMTWGELNIPAAELPKKELEIGALDKFYETCVKVGMYPSSELRARQNGDAHGQRYGLPGDIRMQGHGYEYRSLPSWLDSPWLTFFTLTMTKLVVHDPEIAEPRTRNLETHIKGILQYFRGLDDDARLALWVLERKGIPVHVGGDFKERWGIGEYGTGKLTTPGFFPESIKPQNAEIAELYEHFVNGTPLRVGVIPTPSWEVLNPPKGYEMLLNHTETRGAKGLGEILKDIVVPSELVGAFRVGCHRKYRNEFFTVARTPIKGLMHTSITKFIPQKLVYFHNDVACVSLSEVARHPENFGTTRKFLTSGAFPVWKIADVKPESYVEWKKELNETVVPAKLKFYGQIVEEI